MTDQHSPHRLARKPMSFIVNPKLNLDKQLITLLGVVLAIAFIAQVAAMLYR